MNMAITHAVARQCRSVFLFVSASLLAATPVVAQPAAGSYRIAGKVVSSTSGAPLSRVRVSIAPVTDLNDKLSFITGDGGAFEFKGLAPGKYSLEAARRGFIASAYDAHERFSTAIVTGGDADSEHLVFRLTPHAVLNGRVVDEAGDAVRDANVTLYLRDQSTGVGLTHPVNSSTTDDRGTYEFAELPAGTYFLSANARPWYALHPGSIQKSDGTLESPEGMHSFDVTYPTTYYADVLDTDEATPIPLRGGDRLSVDLHLSPVPALHIAVHVPRSEHGLAMPALLRKSFDSMENITGQAMQLGQLNMAMVQDQNNSTPAEQTMELSGVPPGKYTVFVPDDSAGPGEGALAEVNLDHNGQLLTPSSGEPVSSLNFTVHVAGDPRLPQRLVLALRNAEHKVISASRVDEKGESQFVHLPPGKYSLLAATPGQDYEVTRITINGSPSKGHNLGIAAGSKIEGEVTLIGGTGSVQGFARRDGKAVAGAMVVLVPQDPDNNAEMFRRDQSDLDGSFSLATVIPGEYTIVAIENGWDLDWSQPGVIARYLPNGEKLKVGTAAQGPVELSQSVAVQPR
jgi:uncharacterized protein (DUF2141 family)